MSGPDKVFIVGHAGSGKTLFAKLLSDALQDRSLRAWPVCDCSTILAKRLAHLIHPSFKLPAFTEEKFAAHIVENKTSFREPLLRVGRQLSEDAPGRLLEQACKLGQVVVGARRQAEVLGFYGHSQFLGIERDSYPVAKAAATRCTADYRKHVWIMVQHTNVLPEPSFDENFFALQVCRKTIFNNGNMDLLKSNASLTAIELMTEIN